VPDYSIWVIEYDARRRGTRGGAGVVLWPAFGTHTAGSQVVSVITERNGRWLFAGDNVYTYPGG
jgi:hypothetical protein